MGVEDCRRGIIGAISSERGQTRMPADQNALSRAVAVAAVALCVVVAACSAPRQQGLIDTIPDAKMGRHELRARLREVAYEIIGHTKARSYEIYARAQDSRERWAALQIAIRSNEMMIAAITHEDPVVSLLDSWALIVQMRHLFESDLGRSLVSEYADEVLTGIVLSEGNIIALAQDLADPERVERTRESIETWALEHPLTAGLHRPSLTPEIVGLIPVQERNLYSVADTLDETVNRLSTRLEILNNQLPQQISWQAGLLIESRLGEVDIQALAAQSERVMTLIEGLPQLIDGQRQEVFRQVDLQRDDTLRQVEVIRDDTLAEIDRQRIATIASLDTAVSTTLDRIHDESSLTVGQVERISAGLVQDVNERVLMTVDRAFRRLLILVGVGLAGAAAIATWSLRRPPR